MLFSQDEIRRIEEAELILLGFTVRDVGYDEMPVQLGYDVMYVRSAQDHLRHGKLPGGSSEMPTRPPTLNRDDDTP